MTNTGYEEESNSRSHYTTKAHAPTHACLRLNFPCTGNKVLIEPYINNCIYTYSIHLVPSFFADLIIDSGDVMSLSVSKDVIQPGLVMFPECKVQFL